MTNALDDEPLGELRRQLTKAAEAVLKQVAELYTDALAKYRYDDCEELLAMSELRFLLADGGEARLDGFKNLYFAALDAHRYSDCETLLTLLASSSELYLQHAGRHYRAIMYFEQHLFDKAESLLLGLLAEELTPVQRARSLLELALVVDEQGRWTES